MLSHIRGGKVIRKYDNGQGRVTLENGDTVSPPVAGYINGNDQIVPVVEVTVDNSTTTSTKRATVETVEADRVLRTVTISDMAIEDTRAGMRCSAVEGQLELGEDSWRKVLEYRDQEYIAAADGYPAQEATTWRERIVINGYTEWRRSSQEVQLIGYLIGFTPEQMDALFTAAMKANS